MYLNVINDSYMLVDIESDPDDMYGADSTTTFNHIIGIQISQGVWDLVVDFDVLDNVTYYLVYVEYTTGDSFHYSSGNIQYVGLFRDESTALENIKRIESAGTDSYSIEFINDAGKTWKESISWVGYFEHVENVVCLPVTIIT